MTDLQISPNVQKLVALLNANNIPTCDSGDGTNYAEGMGCARPEPHVIIPAEVGRIDGLSNRVHRLLQHYGVQFDTSKGITVQANYCPCDGQAFIEVLNVTDDMLKESTQTTPPTKRASGQTPRQAIDETCVCWSLQDELRGAAQYESIAEAMGDYVRENKDTEAGTLVKLYGWVLYPIAVTAKDILGPLFDLVNDEWGDDDGLSPLLPNSEVQFAAKDLANTVNALTSNALTLSVEVSVHIQRVEPLRYSIVC